MENRRCFIFGAGERCALRRTPEPGDLVIAADGGWEYCRSLGLRPALIVGDFDSSQRPDTETPVVQLPVEKDDTDTFHAVRLGLERQCREIHIYGGTGGRLDHTLANLQTLLYIARQGGRGYLYDNRSVLTAVENGDLTVSGPRGTLSVFCLGDEARGVSLKGLYYPMENGRLTPDFPLGVSNRIVADRAEIRVEQGALAVWWMDRGEEADFH